MRSGEAHLRAHSRKKHQTRIVSRCRPSGIRKPRSSKLARFVPRSRLVAGNLDIGHQDPKRRCHVSEVNRRRPSRWSGGIARPATRHNRPPTKSGPAGPGNLKISFDRPILAYARSVPREIAYEQAERKKAHAAEFVKRIGNPIASRNSTAGALRNTPSTMG